MAEDTKVKAEIGIEGIDIRSAESGGWIVWRGRREYGEFSPPVKAFSDWDTMLAWLHVATREAA